LGLRRVTATASLSAIALKKPLSVFSQLRFSITTPSRTQIPLYQPSCHTLRATMELSNRLFAVIARMERPSYNN
jgi:hypothetical protein